MRRTILLVAAVLIALAGLLPALAQRPGPPPGGGFRRPPPAREVDKTIPRRSASEDKKAQHGLIRNADLEIASPGDKLPLGFEAEGDFRYSYLGNPTTDRTGWGARLASGEDLDGDGTRQARLTYTCLLYTSRCV